MGAKTERRSLYYESDEDFDPTISVDVNEYLIETWPTLTLTEPGSREGTTHETKEEDK